MNILVDSCSYNCQNVGDLAMLTVAVSRLRELWPAATIQVITNAPHIVARHCGSVQAVPVRGRRLLMEERLLGPVGRLLPSSAATRWREVEGRLRAQQPAIFERSIRWKARHRGRDETDTGVFLSALRHADLLIVNGAGILTDAFQENAHGILSTLALAARRNVPTAMFGQGLGPIDGADLRRHAADALTTVQLIAVRERRASVPLLASLGVQASRVMVTGDDAIELAFPGRDAGRGEVKARKIGINVRIAPYAAVERDYLAVLRHVLGEASRTHGASVVPVPIAHHGGGMDIATLRELLADTAEADGGAALDTPRSVISRISECRVVVTGSYHGAVFALAQGIPVVALAQSSYYVDKMTGVQEQFGTGCEIVRFDEDDLAGRLRAAITRAWNSAEHVREPLLASAAEQLDRSRAAYRRLRDELATAPESQQSGYRRAVSQ